jgi:hypothetical protein
MAGYERKAQLRNRRIAFAQAHKKSLAQWRGKYPPGSISSFFAA